MAEIFQFLSSASLEKLTGRKAENLEGLLDLIKTCPESSIFFHTFSAFRKMREIQAPFNSDFARWVSSSLNEQGLAEKLMAIDLAEYSTIGSLRERLIEIIGGHRLDRPEAFQKPADEPFYLYDVTRIVYRTDRFAYDLRSFRDELATISIDSVYFHYIESRLHSRLQSDDFSTWIEKSLGMRDLAREIRSIDINVYTLEGLTARMLQEIDRYRERAARE